jgi:hypothetical protein
MSKPKQAQAENKRKGRKRTGTVVRTRDGRWQPMIRLADGTKKRFPPLANETTEAEAREQLR